MQLSKIKVMNWKKKNFDFVPGKLNYCFRQNGYGKTSLLGRYPVRAYREPSGDIWWMGLP